MITTAIAAAALLAANAQQFDLVCTGTMFSGFGTTVTERTPTEDRFRIDLERNVWCEGECTNPEPFVSVNAGELMMFDNTNGTAIGRKSLLNRTTGEYRSTINVRQSGTIVFVRTVSECTKAEYTPIPSQKF